MMSGEITLTYQSLLNATVGEIISQTTEPSFSNAAMQRGIDMEPEARTFYEDIKDCEVEEVGFVTNPDIYEEYIGISPDGIVGKGLLEIKCPMVKTHIEYLTKQMLPTVYKWQVQGQMLITGAEFCDFMSYYPNIQPFILRIYPDKLMHEQLLERIELTVGNIKSRIETINKL